MANTTITKETFPKETDNSMLQRLIDSRKQDPDVVNCWLEETSVNKIIYTEWNNVS